MPKILVITKSVQLDKKGIVVPGQCLPATDDWRLVEYQSDDRSEKLLHCGFYDHCRRIQILLAENRDEDLTAELVAIDAEADRRRASNSSFLKKLARRKDS